MVSAETQRTEYTDRVLAKIKNWGKHLNGIYMECQVKTRFAGVIHGLGAWDPGAIRSKLDKMNEAYEMGKGV